VLPTERREVDEKAVGNIFDLAQGGDRAVQIAGIPQDDRGDEEVQAGGAMLLVFVALSSLRFGNQERLCPNRHFSYWVSF
jgi:hypothetical protein